jgi:hypothetical protein
MAAHRFTPHDNVAFRGVPSDGRPSTFAHHSVASPIVVPLHVSKGADACTGIATVAEAHLPEMGLSTTSLRSASPARLTGTGAKRDLPISFHPWTARLQRRFVLQQRAHDLDVLAALASTRTTACPAPAHIIIQRRHWLLGRVSALLFRESRLPVVMPFLRLAASLRTQTGGYENHTSHLEQRNGQSHDGKLRRTAARAATNTVSTRRNTTAPTSDAGADTFTSQAR